MFKDLNHNGYPFLNPVLICGGRQMSKLVVVKAHAIEANIQTQEK